jgi:hypothetical protein
VALTMTRWLTKLARYCVVMMALAAFVLAASCSSPVAPAADSTTLNTIATSTPELRSALRFTLDGATCQGRHQFELAIDSIIVGRPWLAAGIDTSPAYFVRLGSHSVTASIPGLAEWAPLALVIHRPASIYISLTC